jgi:hypothetical protein
MALGILDRGISCRESLWKVKANALLSSMLRFRIYVIPQYSF